MKETEAEMQKRHEREQKERQEVHCTRCRDRGCPWCPNETQEPPM